MDKIIVTSGQPFTDIDALACAQAYTELLQLEGKDSETVLPGPLNKSITSEIKSWKLNFLNKPTTNKAKYVLVDISELKFFPDFVKEKDIIEVYDHRLGFLDYWKRKLKENAKIEMVGACATLIWEEFVKRKRLKVISEISAKLLTTAIVSNTLYFKAAVTTHRDTNAYNNLLKNCNFPKNWIEKYFEEQEKESSINPVKAIKNDSKDLGFGFRIGQMEFWNSRNFFYKHLKEIEKVLSSSGNKEWLFTSPSISEGKNYLFTKNQEIKRLLEKTIGAKFEGDIGTTDKLWLRKEILKEIQTIK